MIHFLTLNPTRKIMEIKNKEIKKAKPEYEIDKKGVQQKKNEKYQTAAEENIGISIKKKSRTLEFR